MNVLCNFHPVNYHISPSLWVVPWGGPTFQYLFLANDYAEVIPKTEHNPTNCLEKKPLPRQTVILHKGNYRNVYGKPVFVPSIS
jgi:hypothetical protein